ncbi:MAG: hypothetical protein ACFFBD_29565, partial [Candidatus Hodarchaeota archaeon]
SPILISTELQKRLNIDDEVLVNFSVSTLSASSIYQSLSTGTSVLVPMPGFQDLKALAFIFMIKNPEVDDERLLEGASTFVAILFPSILLPGLSNIIKAEKYIWEKIKEKDTLQNLIDAEFLENITLNVLREHLI